MGRTLAELISELSSHIAPAKAYTLVQAMLGGISWGEVSDLLMEIDVTLGFVDYDMSWIVMIFRWKWVKFGCDEVLNMLNSIWTGVKSSWKAETAVFGCLLCVSGPVSA